MTPNEKVKLRRRIIRLTADINDQRLTRGDRIGTLVGKTILGVGEDERVVEQWVREMADIFRKNGYEVNRDDINMAEIYAGQIVREAKRSRFYH